MNMRIFKYVSLKAALFFCCFAIALTGCKKEEYVYELVEQQPYSGEKTNLKSDQQYVSVLHANLFQEGISAAEMVSIGRVIQSIGDKRLAYELIVSSFMNDSDVVLPTNQEMRGDVEAFVNDTYERFYVRKPTEDEKTHFINYINNNPDITPELVYVAFAISDEYFFY